MIVLNKSYGKAGGFFECFLVEAFEKETARVTENLGLDQQNVGDGGRSDFQNTVPSLSSCFMYCP